MGMTRTLAAGFSVTGAVAAFLAAAVAVSYVRQVSATLPDHMFLVDWKPPRGTSILARDGSLLGEHASENREFVPLTAIPDTVVDAFVAAEDGKYWTHKGIDVSAIARAALSNIESGPGTRSEGGSTITQQVVKNVILTPERTFDRKVREALLAVRADRDVGKKRILEIYLNEIYFGAGAYGVAAAAETYFGKKVGELDLAEAALLAGLPKAPSAANPFTNPVRAQERRAYVLGRMLDDGYASRDQTDAASSEPLPAQADAAASPPDPAFWYPQEAVRKILIARVGADSLYAGGEDVSTTVDAPLQGVVHRELRKGLVAEDRRSGWRGPLATGIKIPVDWSAAALSPPPGAEEWQVGVVAEAGVNARIITRAGETTIAGGSLGWASARRRADAVLKPGDAVLLADLGKGPELAQIPAVQGAVVMLDPKTGGVLALDGGFSFQTSEFNRATQARRQTGSSFKPFVYLAALQMGYSAMSPLLDAPIAIDQGGGHGDWTPGSGHGGGLGLITLRRSLELSRNLSTVRLLYDIGMKPVEDVAAKLGFVLPPDSSYSTALGAAEFSPLELAAGYAALANGGHRVQPTFFLDEARDVTGEAPVLDPVSVAQLSSVLEGVVSAGTASHAFEGFAHRVAAKTGTTNEARDAWLAAYGPDFVAVAWVGRDDHKPLAKGAEGAKTAAPIVRAILDGAGGALSFGEFMLPQGAAAVRADRMTGMAAEDGDVTEIVREGDGR